MLYFGTIYTGRKKHKSENEVDLTKLLLCSKKRNINKFSKKFEILIETENLSSRKKQQITAISPHFLSETQWKYQYTLKGPSQTPALDFSSDSAEKS